MATRGTTCLSELQNDLLETVYWHRLMSTLQLHELHSPRTSVRTTQRTLAGLRAGGYLDKVLARPPAPLGLGFVTDRGARAVEAGGTERAHRRMVLSPDIARGRLQAHTLAVNDVGLCFVRAARAQGHECGPLAWRHEVAHPTAERPHGGELLVADALLSYEIHRPGTSHVLIQRFIELDRATMPAASMAAKLRRYVSFARSTARPSGGRSIDTPQPWWRNFYAALPHVLVVVTGRPLRLLWNRIEAIVELHRADDVSGSASALQVSLTTLQELTERGPLAPIFWRADDPEVPVDFLGRRRGGRPHAPQAGESG